jgi:outer membrane protein OmpA-like peptidoglycan-associated protein
MRSILIVLASLAVTRIAAAEEAIISLEGETRDLVFDISTLDFGTIENLSEAVQEFAVTESESQIKIEMPGDVLFDFDEAGVRSEAEESLRSITDVLKQHPSSRIRIIGYTDAKGSDEHNLQLSERRASAVKTWLATQAGINRANITIEGRGAASPVAPNQNEDGSDNPEGRQRNRRVEIIIEK